MLEEKIFADYKEALKNRDALKSSVLSFLRADIMNVAVAKKKDKLDDAEVISVIKKQMKQRQDSIEQFTKGNRLEMAQKETQECEILKSYVPAEMSSQELAAVIDEAIKRLNPQGMRDMGKVIKDVNATVAGKADGKAVSDLVRSKLQV